MCDIPNGEGDLGNPDAAKRQLAVAKHYEWVEAAKTDGVPLDPGKRPLCGFSRRTSQASSRWTAKT